MDDRLLKYIKNNSGSRLVETAIDVAYNSPDLREDMLLYIFKYLMEENKAMEKTISNLLKPKNQ